MNQIALIDEIVALPPNQQEAVVQYVSFLKKKSDTPLIKPDVEHILLDDMLVDEDDFTLHINDYALKSTTIEALKDLFEDSPSAEELCEMLTK
jgi:hypothetical protein